MTVAITVNHNTQRLNGTLNYLDQGTANAKIAIYSGPRPASPNDSPGTSNTLLVEITLTKPSGTVSSGQLTLTQQADGLILATGTASWARVFNGAGEVAMDMDCSDTAGTGDLKLSQTQLFAGGSVRLVSAVLS